MRLQREISCFFPFYCEFTFLYFMLGRTTSVARSPAGAVLLEPGRLNVYCSMGLHQQRVMKSAQFGCKEPVWHRHLWALPGDPGFHRNPRLTEPLLGCCLVSCWLGVWSEEERFLLLLSKVCCSAGICRVRTNGQQQCRSDGHVEPCRRGKESCVLCLHSSTWKGGTSTRATC